ncbi:ApbE family lipoprotein [Polynucleobacter hirudinilacicola]|uniref:FAD:protein FMN transferase n=1 Tax=Polynucleobacter hirudinilacicola TaxID=1743166 RepID=A0A210RZ12_9BURK|nr:FAD:protein FMN transferase [Polynucleobacter hirudinilacicola]OWF66255.1 ApbE family lipoprotein [Polynucleobacter hirudinilacicola]
MTIRCQALLGTFVEITIDQEGDGAINKAFTAVGQVQHLMSFYDPLSELNQINRWAHQVSLVVHPWTAEIIKIAQEIYQQSNGLFNCGIGHRLVAAGLLPRHLNLSQYELGGIEDIHFIDPQTLRVSKPVCLDLGGIAKGFAVDKAVESLLASGIQSGCVNAGGDLRVFGAPRPIHIRNPRLPNQLIDIGSLQSGAIATSGLYFSNRDEEQSHIINPFAKDESEAHLHFSGSYSVLASQCVYADALTKVLALSGIHDHACFTYFSAKAIRIAA